MSDHEFKKTLNEASADIPDISNELKERLSNFVVQHKDDDLKNENISINRSWYFATVAIVVLSACAWVFISNYEKNNTDIKHPELNYKEILVNAKLPELKIPAIKTPKVDVVVSNKVGRDILAFLNDKNNNPYEKELDSFAKLSKRIADNFSEELLLDRFKQQN